MKNDKKTKSELIEELDSARRKIKKLETLLKKREHTEKDITERKRAEQRIADALNYNQAIFDASPIGIVTYKENGEPISVNRAAVEITGATIEQLMMHNYRELKSWEFSGMRAAVDTAFATGEESTGDFHHVTTFGKDIWLFVHFIPFMHQGRKELLALLSDITERKNGEESLKQAVEWQDAIFEGSRDSIFISDQNSQFVAVNTAACNLTGYSREQLLRMRIPDLHDQPDLVAYNAYNQRIFNGEEILSEAKILRSDGSKVDTEFNNRRVTIAGKLFMHTTAHDITERKRAEEELRESEQRLSSIYDTVGDVIFNLAVEGEEKYRFISINQAFSNVTGLSQEQVVGKMVNEVIHEPSLSMVLGKYRQAIEENSIIRWEEISNYPTGRLTGDVSIAPVVDDKGRCINLVGSVHDITERKRAEEMLRESEDRYRTFFNTSRDCVFITSIDGNWIDMNDAAIELFGYSSREELMQVKISNLYSNAEDRAKHIKIIAERGYTKDYPIDLCKKDGVVVHTLITSSVRYDADGHVIGFMGTIRDITERKRAEEALRQLQKLEGLGVLAGGIAHDFNNILGIILAYNTSIERSKGDAKKLDLATETITKAVQRGKTLVQQILTFARKTETAFGAVNVNDVVIEIMTMIFETFPKVLTYSQNIEKGIPFINADRSQLNQALLNLCVNARDAMPSGGVLTINTRMESVAILRHQHPDAAASSYVCIEVSDTGEGMTEETQKRIFEPFFTTKGIGKGTGLGLSVVFGVVHTHKGFIDVESELGKGTIFRLYLPASQVAEPIIEKEEETLEEIPGGTETLLVVEDEEMLMMSLQTVLVEKGYNVLSAGDGLTALKIYQERKTEIALVLTDLGLPNMTGLEVCQQIKKINPKERIILATGYLDPEMKAEFLKAGIQHFLFKPYDLKKVLKVIREVLDEK